MSTIEGSTVGQVVTQSDILSEGIVCPENLSGDALMMYLSTRLGAIDSQINALLEKQKKTEQLRQTLMAIQNALAPLGEDGGVLTDEACGELGNLFATLHELDPGLAEKLNADLKAADIYAAPADAKANFADPTAGSPLDPDNNEQICFRTTYDKKTTSAIKELVGSRIRSLETGAQMEMLFLQNLMQARSTAISMATNLCDKCGKSQEDTVSKI